MVDDLQDDNRECKQTRTSSSHTFNPYATYSKAVELSRLDVFQPNYSTYTVIWQVQPAKIFGLLIYSVKLNLNDVNFFSYIIRHDQYFFTFITDFHSK